MARPVKRNEVGCTTLPSVECEDSGMDRESVTTESCAFVRKLDFKSSARAFDAAFVKK